MCNKVVIVSQNQAAFLVPMVAKLDKDINYVVVLDRCSDNSEYICIREQIPYIKTDLTCEGFYAGYARNMGVGTFEGNVLFLDGDRVPQFMVTNEFISLYANKWGMSLLRDKDLADHRRYMYRTDYVLSAPQKQYADIASCGMILSKASIDIIKIHNGGRIFNAYMDGFWGCEDAQLGDILFYSGISVGFISDKYVLSGFNYMSGFNQMLKDLAKVQYAKRRKLKDNYVLSSLSKSPVDEVTPFCIKPFTSMVLYPDFAAPCGCPRSLLDYYYEDIAQVKYTTCNYNLQYIWQHPLYNMLRNSVIRNTYWFCDYVNCTHKDMHSIQDLKTNKTLRSKLGLEMCNAIVDFVNVKGGTIFNSNPTDVVLSTSRACNLACKHCRADYITNTTADPMLKIRGNKFFSSLKILSLAGDGEVFYDPYYKGFIYSDLATEFNCLEDLFILTNGILATEDTVKAMCMANPNINIHFNVSIPGTQNINVTSMYKDYNYDVFETNIKHLSQLRKSLSIKSLSATFVYQKTNFRDLHNTISFLEDLGFDSLNIQYLYNPWGSSWARLPNGVVTTDRPEFDEHIQTISGIKPKSIKCTVSFDSKSTI